MSSGLAPLLFWGRLHETDQHDTQELLCNIYEAIVEAI